MGVGTKKRHQLAWNPEYCWQLLRRNPYYRAAVEGAVNKAKKENDKDFLAAYKFLSLDIASPIGHKRAIKGKLTREEQLRRWGIYSKDLFKIQNIDWSPFDPPAKKYRTIDFSSEHYQDFAALYGDIIHFPINPDTKKPYVEALNTVWAFSPVKQVSPNFLRHLNEYNQHVTLNPHLSYFLISINPHFKPSVVANQLMEYIKYDHSVSGLLNLKAKWDKKEFQEYIDVYDRCTEQIQEGGRPKYYDIGKKIAPKEISTKSEETIKSWTQHRFNYVRKKLIPLFDRKMKNNNSSPRQFI